MSDRLLAANLGMRMGDMGPRAGWCFSASLKMLDNSPTELVERGVKIIHSTRGWADTNEDGIRHFFRQKRRAEAAKSATPAGAGGGGGSEAAGGGVA